MRCLFILCNNSSLLFYCFIVLHIHSGFASSFMFLLFLYFYHIFVGHVSINITYLLICKMQTFDNDTNCAEITIKSSRVSRRFNQLMTMVFLQLAASNFGDNFTKSKLLSTFFDDWKQTKFQTQNIKFPPHLKHVVTLLLKYKHAKNV